MKHARPDYDRFQDPAGKIPADEPVFLLRGQDVLAHMAVRHYAFMAEQAGAADIAAASIRHADEMRAWAKKVPDMPAEAPEVRNTEADLHPRVSRIERLMANLEDGMPVGRGVNTMQEARQLILDLLKMSDKPIGESIYAACCREAEKLAESEGTPDDLLLAVQFAKRWLPEFFEASDQGQVSFARAVCDSLVVVAERHLRTLGKTVEA